MKFAACLVLAFLFESIHAHPIDEVEDIGQLQVQETPLNQQVDSPMGVEVLEVHLREKREPKKKRGSAEVSVNRDRAGTDVNARVNANIWESRNGRSQLNGEANYNRHFGGPGGSSRPNYGAGLNFVHRF